jgi:hypothetical protein
VKYGYLRRKVAGVAATRDRRHGRELRARRDRDRLAGVVPVQVPLEQCVVSAVELCTLLASGHRGIVVAACDLDVEGLGPELPLGDGSVVMDRHDLCAQDVVAARDLLGDCNGLLVVVVVEDGVGAPVAGLLLLAALREAAGAVVDQGTLVDLEELQRRLVNVLAVTVAGREPGGGPAVVGAVPALLAAVAGSLMVPGEAHLGTGWDIGSVGRGRSILVRNDIGVREFVTHDWLVSPALVGPPCGGLVARVLLGSGTETIVRLAAGFELLNRSMTSNSGNEGCQKGTSLEDLRHDDLLSWLSSLKEWCVKCEGREFRNV